MIVIKKKRHGISYKYVWFADRPRLRWAFGFIFCAQCKRGGAQLGFVRRPFTTRLVDLRGSADELLNGMSRRTATDVRRASREGIVCQPIPTAEEFLRFFNAFAAAQALPLATMDELAGWGSQVVGLLANLDGDAAVMHTYVVDRGESRARLLHSASRFRQAANNDQRAEVGRANRLLHYQAMLHFKQLGIATYDVGGFAKDSPDPRLSNIAKFKATLGGREVVEDHYVSLPLHAVQSAATAVPLAKAWLTRWWTNVRTGRPHGDAPSVAVEPRS